MKNKLILLLLVAMILTPIDLWAEGYSTAIMVKGERLPREFEVKNIGGHTFLPVRYIGELFDFRLDWIPQGRQVKIYGAGTDLSLAIGSRLAYKNGQKVDLPVAPYISPNGVTYVPARFVSEGLGIPIDWDGQHRLVLVGDKDVVRIPDGKAYTIAGARYSLDIPREIVDQVVLIQGRRFVHVCEKSNYDLYKDQGANSFPFGTIFTIDVDTDQVRSSQAQNERLFYYNKARGDYVSIAGPKEAQFDSLDQALTSNYLKIKAYENEIIDSFRKN